MAVATKASVEEDVRAGVMRYHREQQGKEPDWSHAHLHGNVIHIYSRGIFTPTEEALLAQTNGRKLVTAARRELRSLTRDVADECVRRATGCQVLRSFYDLDVRVGEQMEAYILDEDLEQRLNRHEML